MEAQQAEKQELLAKLAARNVLAVEAARSATDANMNAARAEEALAGRQALEARLRAAAQQAEEERDFWRQQAEHSRQEMYGRASDASSGATGGAEAAAPPLPGRGPGPFGYMQVDPATLPGHWSADAVEAAQEGPAA
eukprot:SAG22_NODE_6496_length_847_cov_0.741979_1_plen_136_part_10